MTYYKLQRIKRLVAIELARKILASADFSLGLELLTEEQQDAYLFVEGLYYDGRLRYDELWAMCPKNPLPPE